MSGAYLKREEMMDGSSLALPLGKAAPLREDMGRVERHDGTT